MAKRYYWLKLKNDFFKQKEIKRLRRIAGGDTYTIIYLKLLLLSLETEGKIYFDGVGDDFVDELALEMDEDIENIQVTLTYLENKGLLEVVNEHEYFLNEVPTMVGSESESAQRVRRHREQKKLLQCNGEALLRNGNVISSNTEKEKEKDIELEKEKEAPKKRKKYKYEEEHFQLAKLLLREIRKNNPNAKEPNLEAWANDFRLMMERDKREGKQIQELILFSQQHDFWHKNILSANTLRKQYDRLILEMKEKGKGASNETYKRGNEESAQYEFKTKRNLW